MKTRKRDLQQQPLSAFERMPITDVNIEDMPGYFRASGNSVYRNTYIYCGETKPSGNGMNAYVQERECSNHFCRVLSNHGYYALVVRDDGTCWDICLSVYKDVWLVRAKKKQEAET